MFGFFTNNSENLDKRIDGNQDKTTRTIALVLLWAFIASLLLLFIGNFTSHLFLTNKDDEAFRKEWLDLLKNGLILLGSALTTIIGYYFGQRQGVIKSQQAEQKVKETEQNADKLTKSILEDRDSAVKGGAVSVSDSPDQQTPPTIEDNNDIIVP